jgi:glutathione S-transferase
MKIYGVEGFPKPPRIGMAPAGKGATGQVQFIPVDMMQDQHRSVALRQNNPDATAPFLELENGASIPHCTAITEDIAAFSPRLAYPQSRPI